MSLLALPVEALVVAVAHVDDRDHVFDVVFLYVFPILFVLAALVLVVHFFRGRAAGTLTAVSRRDDRFALALLMVFTLRTISTAWPLVVAAALCWLVTMVRTPLPTTPES